MRFLFFGVLIILSVYPAISKDYDYSTSPRIDSLLHVLERIPDDSVKVDKLYAIAWGCKHTHPEKALSTARQALKIATNINYKRGIADAGHALGMVYWYQGQYSQAAQFYFQAMQIRKELKDSVRLGSSYNNVGNVYFYQKKYKEASHFYQLSKDIRVQFKDSVGIVYSLNKLGDISEAEKDFEKAFNFFQEASSLARLIQNDKSLAFTLENVGDFYLEQQSFIPAFDHFEESYDLCQKINYHLGSIKGLNGMAKALVLMEKNLERSIELSRKAVDLAKKINAKRLQIDAQINMAAAHALLGEYRHAFNLERKSRFLEMEITDESRERATIETEIQYNVEKHKSEIFAQESQLLQQNQELSQLQILIVFFFLIGAIIIAGLLNDRFEEQSAMNVALEAKNQELQKSNEALERFAYASSHDLKEPLRTIGSYVTLLQRRYGEKLDKEGKEYVGFVVSGVNRMYALLEDLLKYSRLIHQKKEVKEAVDFNKIIQEVTESLNDHLREKEVVLEVSPMPYVVSNPFQMQQLFQNLINNAIKFNDKDQPIVAIDYEKRNGEHLFAVKDNGLGIEAQFQEQIFDVFKRLSREGYDGSGVGLAICKQIVEQHKGKIWVNSTEGEGSTFYFTIPHLQN